jgi:hypothetical protein
MAVGQMGNVHPTNISSAAVTPYTLSKYAEGPRTLPKFAKVQSTTAQTATSTLTLTLGAASKAGNLLVLYVAMDGGVTTPTGWTAQASGSQAAGLGCAVFTKISTGETTVAVTVSNGYSGSSGALEEYQGVQAVAGAAGANSSTTASISIPAGAYALAALGNYQPGSQPTVPAGWTVDEYQSSGSQYITVAHQVIATLGNYACAFSGNTNNCGAVILYLLIAVFVAPVGDPSAQPTEVTNDGIAVVEPEPTPRVVDELE